MLLRNSMRIFSSSGVHYEADILVGEHVHSPTSKVISTNGPSWIALICSTRYIV